jgi:hypothetical protein
MPELKQDWSELKQRLQERYPGLTEKELDATEGERDALVALLELRLGFGRQNAEQDVDRLLEEVPAHRSD